MESAFAQQDDNFDFMSPLASCSDIDLTLPFEDEFQNRLSLQSKRTDFHGGEDTSDIDVEDDEFQRLRERKDRLTEMKSPHHEQRKSLTAYAHNEKQPGSAKSRIDVRDDDKLDEYHQGLLQISGTRAEVYRPSFHNLNSTDQKRRDPTKHINMAHCSRATRQKQKRRPSRLVLFNERYIQAEAYNKEKFWLGEDGGATPRMTLTRHDMRADERDIYGWKDDVYKRHAVYLVPLT